MTLEHGTWPALNAHRRAGEPFCPACRALKTADEHARRAANRERQRELDRIAQQRHRGTDTYRCPCCGTRVGALGRCLANHHHGAVLCAGSGAYAA